MKGRITSCLIFLIIFCFAGLANATIPSKRMSWDEWVAQLKQEAVTQGVDPYVFDQAFNGLQPGKKQLHFDRTQPEKRLTYIKYRNTRIDSYRIKIGISKFNQNKQVLMGIGRDFGVDPCFVTAIWGIETSYGHYLGHFPVIKSLATLAYSSDRYVFFRKELIYALQILQAGHVAPEDFKGEWAGASGHPQFLPSSWYKYAVDYNGDNKKNIWKDKADALASIANYLKMNGWQTGEPWGVQVRLPGDFNKSLIGLDTKRPLSYWLKLGVRPAAGAYLPAGNIQASIVYPYGGPAFMIFKNFRVLMRYNNSIYYAASVAYLADKICGRQ